MKQYDIESWIDRIQNELDIQKDLQLEMVKMRFLRRELLEMLLMLKDLRDAMEQESKKR